jgi:hypothetical protein
MFATIVTGFAAAVASAAATAAFANVLIIAELPIDLATPALVVR